MKIAVITGASSGLGREFVRLLGSSGTLDEIWAVARRVDKLKELSEISACPVRSIPLDLTQTESFELLAGLLKEAQPEIRVLINAAGFGRLGKSTEIPLKDDNGMIDLNCRAAVALTALALPYMKRGDRILEICSAAAFQPIPRLNVYAATKAFLQSYTKALHYELLTTGIHVTAVCPYWIGDTEFIPGAKTTSSKTFRHIPLASHARTVARWALFDSSLNLWVSTPSPVSAAFRLVAKFVPHCIMVPLMDLFQRV